MRAAIARLVILLIVFCLALGGVTLWWKWQDDRGLPGFLRAEEEKMLQSKRGFTPEVYTLEDAPALELGDVALLARLSSEYSLLVDRVVPSVVSIDTVGERRQRRQYLGQTYERTWSTSGIGSGVIVTPEGHVVTNEHVIEDSLTIYIALHDGRVFPATLIGKDVDLDIAVLRIDGDGPFEALSFGDSAAVETGELVFAVGNPFGLGETVTRGIISAKERSISDHQRDLFQIDATINPGSSGGPLVNVLGEVIGINAAIYSPDDDGREGFAGVGFSIPANEARDSFEQILKRGRPLRGYLGLRGRNLSTRVRYELGYQRGGGVAIDEVTSNGPAEVAGLLANDVVQEYNGTKVRSVNQLIAMIQRNKVGDQVDLKVWRNRRPLNFEAEIVDYDQWRRSNELKQKNTPLADNKMLLRKVGLKLRDLTVLEGMRGAEGVMVDGVYPESMGAEAGLQNGDLIIGINGRRVTKANDLMARIAASAAVQESQLLVKRSSETLDIVLPEALER